ncbi:MAG: NHL repeat-containing protein, partial [Candidatus Latescibacterota bacterium]
MRKTPLLLLAGLFAASIATSKTPVYNQLDTVNLRDRGVSSDERSTHVLAAAGDAVYGATSGDKCHIFRFEPKTGKLTVLATLPGPNTVLKGFALDGDAIYAGTMLTKEQVWWMARKRGIHFEPEDANLQPLDGSWNTGRLYRISGVTGSSPKLEDLGVPAPGQGIHTLAVDSRRGLLYGLTCPTGRFFIYDTKTGKTETVTFGTTASYVSNHMVQAVEVVKDLIDFTPGEVEFNGKMIPRAMQVMSDGVLFTSGWDGRIIRY